MRGRARIGSAAALFGALALVPASIAGGKTDPVQASAACRDFTGPAWTYANGTSAKAPVYRGTRYHYATVRISCATAQRLIRRVITQVWRGNGPFAPNYVRGYGCGGRVPVGKRMVAGFCFSAPGMSSQEDTTSFSWSPAVDDPSSRRIR